jgi:hypothetical protein
MTAVLGFALECAAIAALLGTGASASAMLGAASFRPLLRKLDPSHRADLAFLAGVLPGIVALTGTAAVALPSIASALGFAPDHCLQHGHHLHVCLVHGTPLLRPDLAMLGAAALGIWALRSGSLFAQLVRIHRDASQLERLGTATPGAFPLIHVPGAPRLCHAIGPLRPRILISASLAEQLDPVDLRCALEHETAHLKRRDPLAHVLLSLSGLFALPVWAGALSRAYRSAAEQACDDAAAHAVADGALVATALVKVAGLRRGESRATPALGAFGFGEHPLESRVRRLLSEKAFAVRRARALPLSAWLAVGALAFSVLQAAFVHHAVETALHVVF